MTTSSFGDQLSVSGKCLALRSLLLMLRSINTSLLTCNGFAQVVATIDIRAAARPVGEDTGKPDRR